LHLTPQPSWLAGATGYVGGGGIFAITVLSGPDSQNVSVLLVKSAGKKNPAASKGGGMSKNYSAESF
jgi:hypothetical protein